MRGACVSSSVSHLVATSKSPPPLFNFQQQTFTYYFPHLVSLAPSLSCHPPHIHKFHTQSQFHRVFSLVFTPSLSFCSSMASTALFHSLLCPHSSLPHRSPLDNVSLPLHRSTTSLFRNSTTISRSQLVLGPSKKNRTSFITNCSLDRKESDTEEVPIEKRYLAYPTVMDINQIREILPHRFPFLLVDRVIEYNPGVSAVAIKNVTINDNFFPGHFPERPIMPGVLMVEAMAQVGGIVMLQPEVGGSRDNFFFAGVDKVRFRKPVIAGDTLVMRMTLSQAAETLWNSKNGREGLRWW
ncbi:hypothetical protein F0562_028954 [Nyssa sinensis]|uniref:3-hydroxyacyl-[acyl-carrier-protein] dehydratase n=1 Tax=Nyssa sinensis TaxID=561372 RepID=A0A5J5B2L1_9ASTE|nr:hypothetical protein F0562_028954 [Nyssa sinensis]